MRTNKDLLLAASTIYPHPTPFTGSVADSCFLKPMFRPPLRCAPFYPWQRTIHLSLPHAHRRTADRHLQAEGLHFISIAWIYKGQYRTFGFGEEKVDYGDPERIQYGKNDIGFPAYIANCWRRDLYNQIVANPICGCTDG